MASTIEIQLTTRQEFILSVIALQGENASLTPVQVQKLFFLLDMKIPSEVGGPYFAFEPYDYGPFDATVYRDLESLALRGLAFIGSSNGTRQYKLSDHGYQLGFSKSASFPDNVKAYISRLGSFVRSLSFAELVSSIYKEFPDMKRNSIFQG